MMNKSEITVIICSAGMGSRLGIRGTKSLINVDGKSLIERQLDMLKDYDDIRVAVGYKAESVIKKVNEIRKDVMFVVNQDYKTTGEAFSFSKSLIAARKYVIVIDGDLLINRQDFNNFLDYDGECIGVCSLRSEEPIFVKLDDKNNAVDLNEIQGELEYSCIAKLSSERIVKGDGQLYELIKKILPIKTINVRVRDIDTQDDYIEMIQWYKNGCEE